jgi:hypothetical protein
MHEVNGNVARARSSQLDGKISFIYFVFFTVHNVDYSKAYTDSHRSAPLWSARGTAHTPRFWSSYRVYKQRLDYYF